MEHKIGVACLFMAVFFGAAWWGQLVWRLRGDGTSKIPELFRRLSCLTFPAALGIALDANLYQLILLVGVSYIGVIAGHGRFQTLGRGPYPNRTDNFYGDLAYMMLPSRVPRYSKAFDWWAMTLTGYPLTVAGAGALWASGFGAAGLLLFLLGDAKPMVYEFGWRMYADMADPLADIERLYGAVMGIVYAGVIVAVLAA